ncbi:hypothetical protein STEG23_026326 [Scotinomys teguina]
MNDSITPYGKSCLVSPSAQLNMEILSQKDAVQNPSFDVPPQSWHRMLRAPNCDRHPMPRANSIAVVSLPHRDPQVEVAITSFLTVKSPGILAVAYGDATSTGGTCQTDELFLRCGKDIAVRLFLPWGPHTLCAVVDEWCSCGREQWAWAAPGLLSLVLVDIKTAVVEDSLCSPVPCVFEFSKASPRNPMIVGYRHNENIHFQVDSSQSRAPPGDLSTAEVEDCVLLTRDMLRRENITYLLYVGLEDQKGTVLREDAGLSVSDLTQKPELHIPAYDMAGEPMILTCIIRDTCQEPKALFLSWKEPAMSSNMSVSINPSSELPIARKPEDQDNTLRCYLNLSLDNLTSGKAVKLQLVSPARLLNYSCLLKRTLACSCSFHGIPTPSVQWWVGGTPVSVNSIDSILHMTSTTLEPWTNSTIHLMWELGIIRRLRCEGKNQYGVHASRIFLIPDKSSIASVFLRGLIQGIVYGTIASSLFFFFLVVLVALEYDPSTHRGLPAVSVGVLCCHYVPARIVNISSPVAVNEGGNVNLLCLAVGRPEPTVTWRQLRDGFTSEGEILEISDIQRGQAGEYECITHNGVNSAPDSRRVLVTVNYPPTITDVTSARTALGRAALLRCEAMAVPPADFQWYKDDRLLSSGSAEGLKVQTERTRSMLLFANVSARHYGNYTCRAANRLGASSASMRLLRASVLGGGVGQSCGD